MVRGLGCLDPPAWVMLEKAHPFLERDISGAACLQAAGESSCQEDSQGARSGVPSAGWTQSRSSISPQGAFMLLPATEAQRCWLDWLSLSIPAPSHGLPSPLASLRECPP